jgi:hypothetical protein
MSNSFDIYELTNGKNKIYLIILGEITSEIAWNEACSARLGSPAADG